ncbi:hypothetical protein [Coraliomargarita parva]|uniref:hypothetical protein n=1 Tax=Coraliomargarita parva TaxID=3014050 RepID=UPI0022B58E82|nr:hypothetical protein [Coraliomargarita parva]
MNKIKSLLLPLALVFGAIAIFQFGIQCGATNMRAYAISSQLNLALEFYVPNKASMPPATIKSLEELIDNGIATGATHRNSWCLNLNKQAKVQLDKTLAYALSVRGDAVFDHFANAEEGSSIQNLSEAKLAEITTAIRSAKTELIDNAPSPSEQESAVEAEAARTE